VFVLQCAINKSRPVFTHPPNLFLLTDITNTVWTVDFETPVSKLYLLFISADAAQEKKGKNVLLPTGVSKSTAHAVITKEGLWDNSHSFFSLSHLNFD
jgi:hypothetical protein